MKKTLIALAVAASAVVSGSAMAAGWEQNGTGGSVSLGGSLTPVEKVTPWEVKTGAAVTGLDAQIQKGQKAVSIALTKAAPVLGIRNIAADGFMGAANTIIPQISYGTAVDVDGFSGGVTTLTLDAFNKAGDKLGTMVAPFSAAALNNWTIVDTGESGSLRVMASQAGSSFFGGLGKTDATVPSSVDESYALISSLDGDYVAKFDFGQTKEERIEANEKYSDVRVKYRATYGAGIEQGKTIKLTLDTPAQGDAQIVWKASLPVTVSYQ
ncbi:hypothetical protein HVX30_19725 [Escherichia coli]|nr:hypothetical protein HVX30_19725 [Escherichia coli]